MKSLYMTIRHFMQNILYGNTDNIQFAYRGEDVSIGQNFTYSNEANISLGSHTVVGQNCIMFATHAKITIGNYVMISPNVTFITGEHRTDVVGEYMRNITEDMKLPQNDKPITIEDDVWLGTGAIVLKGVTIGRGSIVHAGAVVTKSIKPYTIYVNKDLKVSRFTAEEIQEHERLLHEKYGVEYPPYVPKDNAFLR